MELQFIFTYILSLLQPNFVSCNVVNLEAGGYTQWREKLEFMPCDPVPECPAKCNERCGPDHKGVSVCASLLEKVDDVACDSSPNSTQVSIYTSSKVYILQKPQSFLKGCVLIW